MLTDQVDRKHTFLDRWFSGFWFKIAAFWAFCAFVRMFAYQASMLLVILAIAVGLACVVFLVHALLDIARHGKQPPEEEQQAAFLRISKPIFSAGWYGFIGSRIWTLAFERLAGGSIRPSVGSVAGSFHAVGSVAGRRLVSIDVTQRRPLMGERTDEIELERSLRTSDGTNVMNATTILRFVVLLTVVPAAAWGNAGPPHVPGRLIGEPNGLDGVVIKHERLNFDLRPLARGGPAHVEALYEIENRGDERMVELIFVSGPMVSDSAAVALDEQPIAAVRKKVDALPPDWQAPKSTPAIAGKGTLPYQAGTVLEMPYFSITLSSGTHQLRVRYRAKPTSYSTGTSPAIYWQLAYILAPARQWAGFGGVDVRVQVPAGWRFASTIALTRSGDEFTGSFDELPADAIAMTAQVRSTPIVGAAVFWLSKLLPLACVVGGPLVLWRLGRRIGRLQGRRLRSVLWALVVSPLAGIVWMVALIVCLVVAFQADLLLIASPQRSQNYANVYLLFYVGILCTLAFPVGLVITLASAFAARLSVATGSDSSEASFTNP